MKWLFVPLCMLTSALAQNLGLDEVIRKVEATQKLTKDFSLRISGQANLESGAQAIDLNVYAIPSLDLTRIEFNAPDALADNILIIDKKVASNYLFLTNQVTLTSLEKTRVDGFNFDFAKFADFGVNLSKDKYNLKLISVENTKEGKVYVIEALSKDDDLARTRVWISDARWRPLKVQALDNRNKVQADLVFSDWKVNSGLKDKDLKKLPKGAQVIKR